MSAFTAQQSRSSLALDLGTTTGYAIADANGRINSGTISFRPSRYDGGGVRYGGERRPPEQVKQDGWREQGLLAVSIDDRRLSWPEREFIRQIGEKLYGKKWEADHG